MLRNRKAESNKVFIFSIVAIVIIIAIVLVLGFFTNFNITGSPINVLATNTKAQASQGVVVTIPSYAVEVADDVFSLGTAIHKGEEVQGYMIIDYGKEYAKPSGVGSGGGASKCYAFLAKGVKWKTTEPWIVNPSNLDGLTDSFVFNTLSTSVETWDEQVAFDIFGNGVTTADILAADTSSPDGLNEVYFGDIGASGAIAVTIVWGIFSGPIQNRKLVEWDMIYDHVDFNFGDAGVTSETTLGDTSVMDLANIGTHEAGHSAGMGHPDDSCTEETMYRFSSFGETKKRTLNLGDIAGIKEFYK